MKKTIYYFLALAFVSYTITGCVKDIDSTPTNVADLELPAIPHNYSDIDLPSHMLMNDNTTAGNEISDHGATLGRVLFYEKAMSKNNVVACASCHEQSLGFADGKKFSTGFEGQQTTRNSMSLTNHRFTNQFFWNSDSRPLEDQVLQPIQNHIEMGMERLEDLELKIGSIPYYDDLFVNAFGSNEVTNEKISKALAQFLRSMVSYDSKYDQGVSSNFSNFNELEKAGLEVFRTKAKCAECHHEELDFAASWRGATNIGLDLDYADEGAGDGHFKIPSLRNIAITAPYMHDGRYENLDEVIEHYNSGVQAHPQLDWSLRDGPNGVQQLNLSLGEKEALKAFLTTLTDEQFVADVKFSNPFMN